MPNDGKRLQAWRESLPGGVSTRAMAAALDWEDTRWWQLEQKERWTGAQVEEVREGVARVLGRTNAGSEARAAWVSFVSGESKARPDQPLAWLPGQSPARRVGRPRGAVARFRSSARGGSAGESSGDSETGGERPVLPEPVLREQAAVVFKMLASGRVDVQTAERAIFDLFEPLVSYYNKSGAQEHDAA
jgi:hypothetical protein